MSLGIIGRDGTTTDNELRVTGAGELPTREQGTPSVVPLGTGINVASSVDVNDGLVANVDAAVAAAAGLRLMGFACRESHATTPAVAAFKIVHGATVGGGTVMIPVELAANESKGPFWFGPDGLDAASGLSIDWTSGTVDVELFYKTVA